MQKDKGNYLFDTHNIEDDFISPFSDFGFNHLFGKEGKARENLLFLLNAILHDYLGFEKIVDVSLKPTELKGENAFKKSIRYDIHCTTDKGHHIIVEMQNRWEPNFDSRLLYYVVESLAMQGIHRFKEDPWDYTFDPVVGIAFCNFKRRDKETDPVAYYNLRDVKTNGKYGDQVNLVYVYIKDFIDKENECKTELERIIYILRNMKTLQQENRNPFSKKDGDFYDTVMVMSRYSQLSPEERLAYVEWRLDHNDQKLREKRAEEKGEAKGEAKGRAEGIIEGREEEKLAIAIKMVKEGMDESLISVITGLSLDEIRKLKA